MDCCWCCFRWPRHRRLRMPPVVWWKDIMTMNEIQNPRQDKQINWIPSLYTYLASICVFLLLLLNLQTLCVFGINHFTIRRAHGSTNNIVVVNYRLIGIGLRQGSRHSRWRKWCCRRKGLLGSGRRWKRQSTRELLSQSELDTAPCCSIHGHFRYNSWLLQRFLTCVWSRIDKVVCCVNLTIFRNDVSPIGMFRCKFYPQFFSRKLFTLLRQYFEATSLAFRKTSWMWIMLGVVNR